MIQSEPDTRRKPSMVRSLSRCCFRCLRGWSSRWPTGASSVLPPLHLPVCAMAQLSRTEQSCWALDAAACGRRHDWGVDGWEGLQPNASSLHPTSHLHQKEEHFLVKFLFLFSHRGEWMDVWVVGIFSLQNLESLRQSVASKFTSASRGEIGHSHWTRVTLKDAGVVRRWGEVGASTSRVTVSLLLYTASCCLDRLCSWTNHKTILRSRGWIAE